MTDFSVVEAGTVRVGRMDVGMGHTHRLVTIAGEPFAVIAFASAPGEFRYCTPCGYCEEGFSGSKSYYAHVASGVCFQCNGTGIYKRYDSEEQAVKIVKRRFADRARRERKEAERMAKMEADRAAWAEANAEVAADLAAIVAEFEGIGSEEAYYDARRAAEDRWGGFVVELAVTAHVRALSEKQTTAVAEAIARQRARNAEREAEQAAQRYYGAEKDKVTFTGTVTVASGFETNYGYSTQYNALLVFAPEGEEFAGVTFKATGTGATLFEASKGDKVEVTGTIKRHDEYQGTKQTVLTRARVKVLVAAEQED